MANGLVEQIGENESNARIKFYDIKGAEYKKEVQGSIPNHEAALKLMSNLLIESGVINDLNELDGIGHVIQDGLLQARRIAEELRRQGLGADHQLEPLFPGAFGQDRTHIGQQAMRAQWHVLDHELAGLDL